MGGFNGDLQICNKGKEDFGENYTLWQDLLQTAGVEAILRSFIPSFSNYSDNNLNLYAAKILYGRCGGGQIMAPSGVRVPIIPS
jgi:hypothetical protein